MTYIITRLCRDCVDTGCVAVCPVDCIYEYTGGDKESFPNQLYIHPDECIDCGACEPECPWQAIYEEVAVPEVFSEDTPLNYKMMDDADSFEVKALGKIDHPSADQIGENKKKWGLTG
jgi:ferredoxin